MSKQYLNTLTGEFVEAKSVQPVTIVKSEQIKFRTNYTDNSVTNDAEHNSGQYIVDDSQYIDFKKLLQRSMNCSKEATDFLSQIPIIDDVGGISEDELDKTVNQSESGVFVDNSAELSTSEVENQQVQETSNPVDNSTDVASEAETNGN